MGSCQPPKSWLLLVLCIAGLTSTSAEGEIEACPVDLASSNFTEYFNALPENRWVLLEFYAHWCGHCRNFKPEYEKVATFFAHRGELQPKVVVARVDCANEAAVCDKFDIKGYPSMKLGLAVDFATANREGLTKLDPMTRNLAGILEFIEKTLDVTFRLEEFDAAATTGGSGDVVQLHTHEPMFRREPSKVDLNDVEGATIKSWEYMMSTHTLLDGLESRQALQDWLDMLLNYHPVPRCREGAKAVREQLDTWWPTEAATPDDALRTKEICPGSEFKGWLLTQDWTSCKGSQPDTRGYSCGLWLLLHTLGAQMPDSSNSGAMWMTSAKGFIKHFFQCSDCSKHYVKYASTEEAYRVQSKQDAMLWMWVAHNKVNGRLAKKEKEQPDLGDKEFPHLIWPTAAQCPKCRKSQDMNGDIPDWDFDHVYRFLVQYYSSEAAPAAEQPQVVAKVEVQGLRGLLAKRNKHASWPEAGIVCGAVVAVVYLSLRGSTQYKLRKSESRLL